MIISIGMAWKVVGVGTAPTQVQDDWEGEPGDGREEGGEGRHMPLVPPTTTTMLLPTMKFAILYHKIHIA